MKSVFTFVFIISEIFKCYCVCLKGRISKRVLQENKARQIFRKTKFSYPLIRTRACVYRGVKNVCFRKICRALFPCNTSFEIRPFALLTTKFGLHSPDSPSFSYFISTIFFLSQMADKFECGNSSYVDSAIITIEI